MNARDNHRLRLWLRLLRTTRFVESQLRERLRQSHGSTLPRFDVMAALARDPDGMTMSALSRALLVSNGNVTGIIERLVNDALVERVSVAGDRRATRVRLTPRGQQRFAHMAHQHQAWVDELLGAVTDNEVATLVESLDRVRKSTCATEDTNT